MFWALSVTTAVTSPAPTAASTSNIVDKIESAMYCLLCTSAFVLIDFQNTGGIFGLTNKIYDAVSVHVRPPIRHKSPSCYSTR
ncbi:hypothetical protein PR003_g10985 [Phytophthora rubi]|uniref:Uncharacterized protein n=1 Tax=Phytophthora rubi TaxID=129364 RepID=A0A6A3MTF4_9STRA|nr:hypothetical protein PR002_g10552 [Phytophthora rubi]KAE9032533.1 hypothetical protein PR001_g10567 [Phytophthora rubi]KAE9339482.1 hypothetical protein PR003_g10985 [Phytophthora rubi]